MFVFSCRILKLLFRAIVNCLVPGFCSLAVSKRCLFFSQFHASFPVNRLWSLPASASLHVLTSCTERLNFPLKGCDLFDSQFCRLETSMSAYLLSYVGRVSFQSRGHSPHLCIVLCWKSVPPIKRSFSTLMYCLMLEECPSNHVVILPTYVTQSAAIISHRAHDPFPVSVVTPNTCVEIPRTTSTSCLGMSFKVD